MWKEHSSIIQSVAQTEKLLSNYTTHCTTLYDAMNIKICCFIVINDSLEELLKLYPDAFLQKYTFILKVFPANRK